MLGKLATWFGLAKALPQKPMDRQRSSRWPAVRKAHLQREPFCRACGGRDRLEVHHVIPFHVAPELELDAGNLITLCEAQARNCHLAFGHLLSWKSWNSSVRQDADAYREKVLHRPQRED